MHFMKFQTSCAGGRKAPTAPSLEYGKLCDCGSVHFMKFHTFWSSCQNAFAKKTKYSGYLPRQVVFRLAVDVSLLKSQAGMRKSVDFDQKLQFLWILTQNHGFCRF